MIAQVYHQPLLTLLSTSGEAAGMIIYEIGVRD